jgi:ribosomal protein L9
MRAAASASGAAATALKRRLDQLEADAKDRKEDSARLATALKGLTSEIDRK